MPRSHTWLGWMIAGLLGALTLANAQEAATSSLSPAVTGPDVILMMDSRIQASTVTLSAGGTASWTYTTPYSSSPILSYMAAGDGGAYPVQCNFTSKTPTSASIRCYRGSPVVISALGASLNAFQGTVTGVQVDIHARPAN